MSNSISNSVQFNMVTGANFSGQNLVACQESVKENGYKSNRWVTYFQASELGLTSEAGLRGKAVGLIRFEKKGKTTTPKWYNVFNADLFDNVPEELLNSKPKASTKKATKKVASKGKKAIKKVAAPAAKAAPVVQQSMKPAIPIAGEPGFYLIANEKGVYSKVELGS